MVLYVDETENERYFIVAGLLLESEVNADDAYKSFKKKITNIRLGQKTKQRIYKEFKSYILDRRYQRIKYGILKAVVETNGRILYSAYTKKAERFGQSQKESVYISLLSTIVSSVDSTVNVVFDGFRKRDFDDRIISEIGSFKNVTCVVCGDSELISGLQFIDNACSVVRLFLSNEDTYGYYEIIKTF